MQTLLQFLEEDYNLRINCKLKSLLKQYTVKEIVAEIMSWILEKKTRYIDILNFARDFYIGSDLTKKQGEVYYAELEWQGFFSLLNNFLYDDDAQTCSWTIYTIGKFSRKENTHFLETAYETNFKLHHPMLAARCLFEMRWLESDKVEGHLETLKSENTLFSKMTLLYFYEPTCNDSNFRFGILIAFGNCIFSRSPKDSCGEAHRTQSKSNKIFDFIYFLYKISFCKKVSLS